MDGAQKSDWAVEPLGLVKYLRLRGKGSGSHERHTPKNHAIHFGFTPPNGPQQKIPPYRPHSNSLGGSSYSIGLFRAKIKVSVCFTWLPAQASAEAEVTYRKKGYSVSPSELLNPP
eukprot:3708494-Amphidinium_carterae.1